MICRGTQRRGIFFGQHFGNDAKVFIFASSLIHNITISRHERFHNNHAHHHDRFAPKGHQPIEIAPRRMDAVGRTYHVSPRQRRRRICDRPFVAHAQRAIHHVRGEIRNGLCHFQQTPIGRRRVHRIHVHRQFVNQPHFTTGGHGARLNNEPT